ncbi:hypothetical protein EAO77_36505 [Streptomyces sp. t39]|nr:hypothetical protein EAO77_36505 [Streptomyces sp. t39]
MRPPPLRAHAVAPARRVAPRRARRIRGDPTAGRGHRDGRAGTGPVVTGARGARRRRAGQGRRLRRGPRRRPSGPARRGGAGQSPGQRPRCS